MNKVDSKNNTMIEMGKRAAAYQAIDENVNKNVKVMGIGSGSTIVYAVDKLAKKVKEENLDILCIPSSFQSKQLLIQHDLKITDLEAHQKIDLTIDGADEIDTELTCIKGGGGCQLQEKLIAYCATEFVLIADIRKNSTKLGQSWFKGVPIEVLPSAYRLVQVTIERLHGGKAMLRQAKVKAGPCITDNGNFLIDWEFDPSLDWNWKEVNNSLKMIPGVIETGLFIQMAKKAYFGNIDGTVKTYQK